MSYRVTYFKTHIRWSGQRKQGTRGGNFLEEDSPNERHQ